MPGLSSIILSPGPYASIFSSFVFYFYDIPVSARMKLLGAEVSDKTFIYIAGSLVAKLFLDFILVGFLCALMILFYIMDKMHTYSSQYSVWSKIL